MTVQCSLWLSSFLSSSLSLSQSYALYIAGDEYATSTDVSKFLVKLSAGRSVFVCVYVYVLCILRPRIYICHWTLSFHLCVNIYWQSTLIIGQSHDSLLQAARTKERKACDADLCHLSFAIGCGVDKKNRAEVKQLLQVVVCFFFFQLTQMDFELVGGERASSATKGNQTMTDDIPYKQCL